MKRLFCAAAAGAGLMALAMPAKAEPASAVFAGGCFWCVESDFDHLEGVTATTSGYIGGTLENPTYEDVSYSDTGHYEAVKVDYDSDVVSYETLVGYFFRSVDPTDAGGQFCDRGDSYRTAIFTFDDAQTAAAEAAKTEAAAVLGTDIVTPILAAPTFYPAEDYHQDYYLKNPIRYDYYRWSCGRDQRVDELWGDEAHAGLEG